MNVRCVRTFGPFGGHLYYSLGEFRFQRLLPARHEFVILFVCGLTKQRLLLSLSDSGRAAEVCTGCALT